MSFHSPRSSSSKYDQRYELFKTKLKEQNQVISMRKDALNFSYEIAMKKFQTPKSEKKKKVPFIYANSYVIPQTPNAPYMPFDKTLSPAERFDKKWQYRLSSIYSNEVPIIKYEKIDFASDFKLSDSDSEKEKSGNKESSDHQENENEQQRVDDNNKNEKKENSHQEKEKNENNNQENQDTTNNDINNSNNSANSEDLKIEDLEGSNNEFIEEEEEEANESQKNSLNNSNNSITKSEKDNSDEEQKTISFIAEEEEEEVDAEMTATQPNDVIDILDNQKDDEEEEEEENILINKKFGSSAIKMSDDVKEIFSFSSDDSQGNGE